MPPPPEPDDDLLALDAALSGELGISTSTADRHWVYARVWLRREVQARKEVKEN